MKLFIPENEYQNKTIGIAEKVLSLITNEKGKGLKILTPKQVLQRISIELHN